MSEEARYQRLGVFVFAALALLVGVLFLLGGRSLFQSTYTFETYFNDSVAGLEVGSPVRFRGVPLGQVTAILPSSTEYEWDVPVEKRRDYIVVRATISQNSDWIQRIRRDTGDLIKAGLRAQTQLAGITGQQYLGLDLLDPRQYPPLPFDWKAKYVYVPSAPSLTSQIIDQRAALPGKPGQARPAEAGTQRQQAARDSRQQDIRGAGHRAVRRSVPRS